MNTETTLLNFMGMVCEGLNRGKRVSGLFLDIKKAFDTVDHNILLSKLYNCGVRGVALDWFCDYLSLRTQCVKVNGIFSDMGRIKCGVPQGSVLGPTLFLVYINDLCNARLQGKVTSFADDTALCYTANLLTDIESAINSDLMALQWWFTKNKMVLSPEKTNYINFSLRDPVSFDAPLVYKCLDCLCDNSTCNINCKEIKGCNSVKYLGLILDCEVSWKFHINHLKSKLSSTLRIFYFLRKMCSQRILRLLYFALVHSRLDYGISCWGGTYKTNLSTILKLQKQFIRITLNKKKTDSSYPLFLSLKVLPLRSLFIYKVLKLFYSSSGSLPDVDIRNYRSKLRSGSNFVIPKPNLTHFTRTFHFLAPRIFNKIPNSIKRYKSKSAFLSQIMKWLLSFQDIEFLIEVQG